MEWRQSLFEFLKSFDEPLFRLINNSWSNPFFDNFFPAITDLHKNPYVTFGLVPLLLIFLVWRLGRWGAIFICSLLLSLGLDDALGGQIIKPFFARPRPIDSLSDVTERSSQYGGFSFLSNHAMNMFCLAAFVTYFYPRLGRFFLLLAALVSYSRVYCGVHYPSDILGGALIGYLVGWFAAKATAHLTDRYFKGLQHGQGSRHRS